MIVAMRDGAAVRLRDVARVHRGHKEREEITHVDGRECVEIAIYKEGDANIVDVARRVRERSRALKKTLPPGATSSQCSSTNRSSSRTRSTKCATTRSRAASSRSSCSSSSCAICAARSSSALSIPISILATFVLMYTMQRLAQHHVARRARARRRHARGQLDRGAGVRVSQTGRRRGRRRLGRGSRCAERRKWAERSSGRR